jgi:hypothetical protein
VADKQFERGKERRRTRSSKSEFKMQESERFDLDRAEKTRKQIERNNGKFCRWLPERLRLVEKQDLLTR